MDCREFISMLDQLEGDTLMPAGVRSRALQHAESCACCRARLAASRLLSLELRALARDDQKLQAPAFVQAALLTAFRGNFRRRIGIWQGLAWASAAAGLALGAWLVTAHVRRHSAPVAPGSIQAAQPAGAPPPHSAAPVVKRRQEAVARPASRSHSRRVGHRAADATAADFIALSPWATSYPLGDDMVLRVQLPRSAPALLGLPLGGDMSGTVTADVVLGQDGVARAIRFVPSGQSGAANPSSGFTRN